MRRVSVLCPSSCSPFALDPLGLWTRGSFCPCSSCNARAARLPQNLISAAFACGVAISPSEIDALVQRYDLYGHSKVELLDVRVIK